MKNPIRKIIKTYMSMNDIDSFTELSKLTGLCRQTLYDRINNPGSFRVYEILALDEVLHFTDEHLVQLIRG